MIRIIPKNKSVGAGNSWTEDGLTFTELIRQEYGGNGAIFSTGVIEGHPIEQVYFKWEKADQDGGLLMLTIDELAAISWVASGTLWSWTLGEDE